MKVLENVKTQPMVFKIVKGTAANGTNFMVQKAVKTKLITPKALMQEFCAASVVAALLVETKRVATKRVATMMAAIRNLLGSAMILTTEHWTSMKTTAMVIPLHIIVILQVTGILDSMPMCSAAYAVEEPMTSLKLTKSLLINVKTHQMVLVIQNGMVAKIMRDGLRVAHLVNGLPSFGTKALMQMKCAVPVVEDLLPEKK